MECSSRIFKADCSSSVVSKVSLQPFFVIANTFLPLELLLLVYSLLIKQFKNLFWSSEIMLEQ